MRVGNSKSLVLCQISFATLSNSFYFKIPNFEFLNIPLHLLKYLKNSNQLVVMELFKISFISITIYQIKMGQVSMTKLHKNCQGLGETKKFDRDVAAIQPRLSTEQFEIEYLPHKSQYEADAIRRTFKDEYQPKNLPFSET